MGMVSRGRLVEAVNASKLLQLPKSLGSFVVARRIVFADSANRHLALSF